MPCYHDESMCFLPAFFLALLCPKLNMFLIQTILTSGHSRVRGGGCGMEWPPPGGEASFSDSIWGKRQVTHPPGWRDSDGLVFNFPRRFRNNKVTCFYKVGCDPSPTVVGRFYALGLVGIGPGFPPRPGLYVLATVGLGPAAPPKVCVVLVPLAQGQPFFFRSEPPPPHASGSSMVRCLAVALSCLTLVVVGVAGDPLNRIPLPNQENSNTGA